MSGSSISRRHALVAAALLVVGGALSPAAAQQASGRGITPEDYFAFELASDPHISPDGSQVVYVVSRVDRGQNRRVPSIWVAPTDGSGAPRLLVGEAWSSGAPRWSPDGKSIAFISAYTPQDSAAAANPASPPGTPAVPGAAGGARGAGAGRAAQLWVMSAAGGRARRVTNVKNGVNGCMWSPDGARAACLSRTGASDAWPAGKERTDVRHYSHISYKFNDTGWYDDRRSHIWVIDIASGNARQITSGDDWNDTDPQWSPDGARIAFVSDRTGHEYDGGRDTDVWVIPAAGGNLTKISTGTGHDDSPRWSPDGKTIAFVTSAAEDDPPRVMVAPSAGGGSATSVAPELDLIPTELQWGETGRALYFGTGVRGEYHVYRIDPATHAVQQVTTGPRAVRSVSVSPAGRTMVYLVNDFQHLDDVYRADIDGKNEKKLSNLNVALWKQLALMPVEKITYKGADGWDIDGFLVKPLGWTAGKSYPMVLSIHGGPAGQYGVDWFHEFQVYSAHGWAVFFTNPRGSTGYGRKFQRGIAGEWGGKDYIDIMNGVDAALAKNPWIDRDRLGVTGGSYGGFMTNWIVGHTNRFKAAVTLRAISNFISDDATRDGAYGHSDDFGGDIFQKHDLYWERSPIKYVQNVTTPILILHSDNDYRVPIEQGEQWFRGLKHFGKTAEIVFFPRENHNLTRTGEPKHLVESLNWQLYWFDKYLNSNDKAVAPDQR